MDWDDRVHFKGGVTNRHEVVFGISYTHRPKGHVAWRGRQPASLTLQCLIFWVEITYVSAQELRDQVQRRQMHE